MNQGNKIECNIPPIKSGDTYIFDDLGKAESFNKYFTEQSTIYDSNALLHPEFTPTTCRCAIDSFQHEEILNIP